MKVSGPARPANDMRVLVIIESRFNRTPDGAYWTVGWAGYSFWERYLDVFDEVQVVARVRDMPTAPPSSVRADGPKVSLTPLPYYLGPWAYLRNYRKIRRAIGNALHPSDAVIVRAPGAAGALLVAMLRRTHRPYGMEVVGDPYDVLAPGSVRSILRPLLRWWMPRSLRRQCAGACAASYVTSTTLQNRYPAPAAMHVTSYSSADLPDEAFVREPRPPCQADRPRRIVFVGTLEQLYKAPDVLIDAVAIAVRRGADLQVTIIGEGKHRRELEARAGDRGLADRVRFAGHLPPGDAIRSELDRADLFILPSRQEGLPRALIEAMARGVPGIGSSTGGIPELLPSSERVPAGDADALAAKILEVLGDPERLARLSAEHLKKAREYHAEFLRPRRQAFYRTVQEATSNWQRSQ